ncbi:MAG: hypothetical protein F6K30_22055, partial [Cyanothece sp. SIO2G6]|nr:hypothetical protein [Cyanothece sp. SIO2G6]
SVSFACEADALHAAERLSQQWAWHRLDSLVVAERKHYAKPGKPKADTPPSHISYHLTAEIVPDAEAVSRRERRAGRFILATNRVVRKLSRVPTAWALYLNFRTGLMIGPLRPSVPPKP